MILRNKIFFSFSGFIFFFSTNGSILVASNSSINNSINGSITSGQVLSTPVVNNYNNDKAKEIKKEVFNDKKASGCKELSCIKKQQGPKKTNQAAKKREERAQERYAELIKEYKKIKKSDITFENKRLKKGEFLLGMGTSSYQVEGSDGAETEQYCQWQMFNGKAVEMEVDNRKEMKVIQDPGSACEHWKRYKEDIKLLKNSGCNAYRFSVSWGKIVPKEGVFSEKALAHYEDVCKELKRNGIRPVITLYHYAYPVWFENIGAFTKEENVKHFVDFGLKVFERLNKYDPIWFPINCFEGCLHAYYMGTKAPFKKDMNLALKVLKNVLNAYVDFYRKAKEKAKSLKQESQIGIYKIVFPMDKYRSWQVWDGIGVSYVEKLNNDCIYDFFTKGVLDVSVGISVIGVKGSVHCKNPQAVGAFDCLGLNYYTGAYISNFKVLPRVGIPTQSSLATIYPEGFAVAIDQINKKLAQKFNVPIYVTENGIPTGNDDYRDVFYRTHLKELSKALNNGVDIRGYIVWAFLDSFDWLEAYDFTYGVYAVDRKTQKRTLKKGSEFLVDVFKSYTGYGLKDKKHVSKVSALGSDLDSDLALNSFTDVKGLGQKEFKQAQDGVLSNTVSVNKLETIHDNSFGDKLENKLDNKFGNKKESEKLKEVKSGTKVEVACRKKDLGSGASNNMIVVQNIANSPVKCLNEIKYNKILA